MDQFTQTIADSLQQKGISIDAPLLAKHIGKLKCQFPEPFEVAGVDAGVIYLKALKSGTIIALVTDPLTSPPDNAEGVVCSVGSQAGGGSRMDPEDEETKAHLERRSIMRLAIEEASKRTEELNSDPNPTLPKIVKQGPSWSIIF